MLEKPDLQLDSLIAVLHKAFALHIVRLDFLPLGADQNTAVYRAVAEDGAPYFVKLRRGAFDETSVLLPRFLRDQGIAQVIPPLPARDGRLWTALGAFTATVYPFVEGHNGYRVDLSDRQWRELGSALRRIHTLNLPPRLVRGIRRETFSTRWREALQSTLARLAEADTADPIAAELTAFLRSNRDQTLGLVARADQLALVVQARPPEFILCHGDIHAGNVHVDDAGALYIVDWDDPVLAPKERDLMFVGGGLFGQWRSPEAEETPFYQGYGSTEVNPAALAYYRCERIVEDIAVFCQQILEAKQSSEDREQSLVYLISNFLPGNTIELACVCERQP